jgi:hypothetical protein
MPRIAFYFYRLMRDDFVREFCVANHADPHQTVETLAPDGTHQCWDRREEGDLLIFRPPDGYAGDQGLLWSYDRRLQIGQALPRPALEHEALNGRISIHFPSQPI